MTQKEKELLLQDLCARLPYGVKFKAEGDENLQEIYYIRDEEIFTRIYPNLPYWIETIKPYLRPMSSMTEEESIEYFETFEWEQDLNGGNYPDKPTYKTFDWLNKKYFDYRGLIGKGFALEAPKGMYKIE